jgi:acyl dehydratase
VTKGDNVSPEIEALEKGHRFPAVAFVLDQETVARYLEAVEDQALSPLAEAEGKAFAPPMAVAAFALRSLMEAMALPAGAVHASQEFQLLRPALVGEKITTSAWLAQRSQRSEWLVLGVELEATGDGGEPVLRGRVSALIPR